MILTKTEIKELVELLLDCRSKLLWMISQNPINEEQEKFIENGKELLLKVNKHLEDFNVTLPG